MSNQHPQYEFQTFDDFLAAPVDWDLRGNPIPRAATLHGSWAAAARYGFESARKLRQNDNQVRGPVDSISTPFTAVANSSPQTPEEYSQYKDKYPTDPSIA